MPKRLLIAELLAQCTRQAVSAELMAYRIGAIVRLIRPGPKSDYHNAQELTEFEIILSVDEEEQAGKRSRRCIILDRTKENTSRAADRAESLTTL